ncbi:MAG: nucleotidyltransferase domain-containing protein [Candidatus Omnitrophica bacterium]|nr:nucleotidyltransferase domain-containing protein [Candidatus Omnitrophota bacterium]
MSNAKRLGKIKRLLLKYKTMLEKDGFPVESLILYGSYAKGNFKRYSDIDVCIISHKFLKNKDYYETFLWKKVLEVDSRIQPVGYHPTDFKDIDPLVNEIKKYGVVIE